MASRKTWIWVLVAAFGLFVLAMTAVAGLGIYFVASNVSTGSSTGADALRTFDQVRGTFGDAQPLLELDRDEQPRATRRLSDLPTSTRKPTTLWILAWDPDEERLSKVSLPFWMLRLGRNKIDVRHRGRSGADFDLEDLDLDFGELERVGPLLVFDLRSNDGRRVMVWTE
ncbi:MAG TPA: hypothetical protein VMM93_04895 [Vicinamibacterales bacterium]|nr:hypothetical protein [Vicinamibacterales bacterium]